MDNLIYHIECDDVYETMIRDIVRFDTSDYSANASREQKSTGLIKDENNGAIMTEFVGFRAKMYTMRARSGRQKGH